MERNKELKNQETNNSRVKIGIDQWATLYFVYHALIR